MIKVNILPLVQELKSRFKTLEPEIAAVSCSYFVGVNSNQSKLGSFFLKCDQDQFQNYQNNPNWVPFFLKYDQDQFSQNEVDHK